MQATQAAAPLRLPRGATESIVATLAAVALVVAWIDFWVLGAPLF